MKTKTIPFDLETAKKIQAGEIKGKIKTRNGKDARVICWDAQYAVCPIIALIKETRMEELGRYNNEGVLYNDGMEHQDDLVLEVPDNEPQFKPFDRVLVRDNDSQLWWADFFSHIGENGIYCTTSGGTFHLCIPFEGNEHLVGTTDKPKEN